MMISSIVMSLLCIGSVLADTCPILNYDTNNPGRCGPQFRGHRCNKHLKSYALYCNTDNGWCGDTDAHKNAQSTDIYDFEPTSCKEAYDSGGYSAKGISEIDMKPGAYTKYPDDYSAKGPDDYSAKGPDDYSAKGISEIDMSQYYHPDSPGFGAKSRRQNYGYDSYGAKSRRQNYGYDSYGAKSRFAPAMSGSGAQLVAESPVSVSWYWMGGLIAAMLAAIAGLLCCAVCIRPLMQPAAAQVKFAPVMNVQDDSEMAQFV